MIPYELTSLLFESPLPCGNIAELHFIIGRIRVERTFLCFSLQFDSIVDSQIFSWTLRLNWGRLNQGSLRWSASLPTVVGMWFVEFLKSASVFKLNLPDRFLTSY